MNSTNTKKMKVAGYIRCSTELQNTELQRREILEYCDRRGWQVYRLYEDFGLSGTNGNRPALKEMLRDSKSKKFDVVLCFKMDRLCRSLRDLVMTLQELNEMGIEFVAIRDQIDLTTASGRLMTHLLGAFAEFEANLIRERVMSGLQNAKAKGKTLGRPRSINIEQVQELRKQGMSLGQIAKIVGATRSAVSKTLRK